LFVNLQPVRLVVVSVTHNMGHVTGALWWTCRLHQFEMFGILQYVRSIILQDLELLEKSHKFQAFLVISARVPFPIIRMLPTCLTCQHFLTFSTLFYYDW